jgi:hypothetical protein
MGEIVKAAAKKPEAKRENKVSQIQKKGTSQSISSPVEQILFLQRTIGNQAVGMLIKSGALQAKLRIGQPGDMYELEADRIAEQVMRMHEPQVSKETKVSIPAGNNSIQRKCPGCKKRIKIEKEEEEEKLQKKEASGSTPDVTPKLESNINAIRGGGQPLPESVRAFYEPRFGHDFSQVRVHSDAKAAEAARAVNARAYTMGKDVVFGAGQYVLQSGEGQRLLAHELTHVVQQCKAGTTTLRRDDKESIPVDLVPTPPEEVKKLKDMGIELPKVSEETWRLIGGVADNAGKTLSSAEKTMIEELLKKYGLPPASPLTAMSGAKFLLHDTSSPVSTATIEKETKAKGPIGKGVSAWVPREGAATIARPEFYESKRPSTSEYEKGIDIIKQADREKLLKEIWKVTKTAEQEASLDRALAGTGLDANEIKKQKTGAESFFKGAAIKDLPDGSRSTAAWAVGEICAKAESSGVAIVAIDGKSVEFDTGCKKLAKYFKERTARVSSIVGVEIVQVGVKDEKGDQNTCNPANPNVKLMPSPPYSDNQYMNIALIYLRAALTAGSFPEVTTHFVVDAFERGHCDPRCFNLQKLYNTIATLLGHGKGSKYGVAPSYGTNWGKNTVWWNDKICGGKNP